MKVWNVGYPRIGQENELSGLVCEFELGNKSPDELLAAGKNILRKRWESQHNCGVDSIPVNDFCFWDHLLDMAWLFNLVPAESSQDGHWLVAQKNLVRGRTEGSFKPLNVRRWFNTNYFCFLPQWDKRNQIKLQADKINWELDCLKGLPYQTHFTLIGPWTLVQLCETGKRPKSELLLEIAPLYQQLLKDLKKKGFEWVQLEEPAMCLDLDKKDIDLINRTYQHFAKGCPKIMLATYYDSPDPWLTDLSELPVQGIHFDLVSGPATLSWIKTRVFPKDKILCLGLVNAQNVWATGLASVYKQIEILKGFHSESKMYLSPSAPLFHLPHSKLNEDWEQTLPKLFQSVSFADERLLELRQLKQALSGDVAMSTLEQEEREQRDRLSQIFEKRDSIRNQINRIEIQNRKRTASGAKRQKLQSKKFFLPKLPVTILDSTEKCPELTEWIEKQNQIEVDVIHSDFRAFDERIQDVASTWKGLTPIKKGWVQRLGSYSVRPPILAGDIEWNGTQSVDIFSRAKELSPKLCKVPLIGPLTLVSLSFTRTDLAFEVIGNQVALSVRQEIKECESAGACFIQIDETNLGALVPLKLGKRTAFFKNCSDIFRLASCGVKDETHTQLVIGQNEISELLDVLTKIDVDSIFCNLPIVDSDTITNLKKTGSETGVGPALLSTQNAWPASDKEMEQAIRKAFEFVAPDRLWVSVDSGLGFRAISDVFGSLKTLVGITKRVRTVLNNLG